MPWTCSENRMPRAEIKLPRLYTGRVEDIHETESSTWQVRKDFLPRSEVISYSVYMVGCSI